MSVRIGLVGAGQMGSLHARVISSSDATELAWVADPDQEVGTSVAERYGSRWVAEPVTTDIDAIVIASPTQFHFEQAMHIIGAGVPLLVEKPLGNSYDEASSIVKAAEAMDVPLMCGLLERFNPAVRTALEIAKEPLHVATMRHSPYTDRIRTGVASDLLIHDVDLVLRLFNEEPSGVSGHYGYFEPRSGATSEDVTECTLRFSQGQIASLSVSRIAQHKVRTLTISELGRVIEVDLLRQVITVYRHVQGAGFDEEAGYRQQTIIDIPVIRHPGEPLQLQLAHFLALLDGRGDKVSERETLLAPHRVLNAIATAASDTTD
jgi:predicted dehydrogenase